MKIKIGLFGGDGKMGQAVQNILSDPEAQKIFSPYVFVGKNPTVKFFCNEKNLNKIDEGVLSLVDVWIDFSSPEGLRDLVKKIEKRNSALVSGTTDLIEKDFKKIKKICKRNKIFWASNLSPGLWVFRQMLKGFEGAGTFDFALEEFHHILKKDKPSGTAKTIKNDLEKIINKKIPAPISYRMGGIFGIHTVFAASKNEIITMQHQALNRTVFAEGALLAAKWIVNKKPGFYSMDDMLKDNIKKRGKK